MKIMSNNNKGREAKFHLWGWLLFLVCAGFFIASNVLTGDLLGLAGSIIFLIACVIFLIPLLAKGKSSKDSEAKKQ